jgi:Leucine-rich repeat (LRR) protein
MLEHSNSLPSYFLMSEENNLVGTIPTEVGLLSELAIWGMERGGLSGGIPSEIGRLTNLIFLDLDFNALTGSLPTELYRLTNLTQLDLNNNFLEGTIDDMGVFGQLEFLQLHANLFNGTIPDAMGGLNRLATFTLHETTFSGTMPESVCNLVVANGGILKSLISDCDPSAPGVAPDIVCDCCTDCRDS